MSARMSEDYSGVKPAAIDPSSGTATRVETYGGDPLTAGRSYFALFASSEKDTHNPSLCIRRAALTGSLATGDYESSIDMKDPERPRSPGSWRLFSRKTDISMAGEQKPWKYRSDRSSDNTPDGGDRIKAVGNGSEPTDNVPSFGLSGPLSQLNSLVQSNKLPLLPGFMLEKAENVDLAEARDLGMLLSKIEATDIAPSQEVPLFLLMQTVTSRLLDSLDKEGYVERDKWQKACAAAVKQALQMNQEMERRLMTETARRIQAEGDCGVLLGTLQTSGKAKTSTLRQQGVVTGEPRSWEQQTAGLPPGWSHWDLPRLNTAATRIQRNFRGNMGRRRYEDHCRRVLRAVDPAFDKHLAGQRPAGRKSTRQAVSDSEFSEGQMMAVMRRRCHELEAMLKDERRTLEVMREEVQELVTANEGLRENNKQLEEMSQVKAQLREATEAGRLLQRDNEKLRAKLNAIQPAVGVDGPRLPPPQRAVDIVAASGGRPTGDGMGEADCSTDVGDWGSLRSLPSTPMLGHLGGPVQPPSAQLHERMPTADMQASAGLPVPLQQQLPPFPSTSMRMREAKSPPAGRSGGSEDESSDAQQLKST